MNNIGESIRSGTNIVNSMEEAMAIGAEGYIKGNRSESSNDYLLVVSALKPDFKPWFA